MTECQEYLAVFDKFINEFSKIRDLLKNAGDAMNVIDDYWQSAESKRKGIEYLSCILADAIAKCESAAEILEGAHKNRMGDRKMNEDIIKEFYVEIAKLRDILDHADTIARGIITNDDHSESSRLWGAEYLKAILGDALERSTNAVAILKGEINSGGEAYWRTVKERITHDVCDGSDYPEESVDHFLKPYIIEAYIAGVGLDND